MDNDFYTEETTESWTGRIGDSIKGILFGLVLFIGAFPLIWWNEGRSVERYNSLNEGLAAVIAAPSDKVDASNEGKLVHTHGLAATDEVLSDPVFGVSATAIKLIREVSMYQWTEDVDTKTEEKTGGSKTTKTTYNYNKEWRAEPISSGSFKKPAGHENPAMAYQSQTLQAQKVSLGAFALNSGQIGTISGEEALSTQTAQVPAQLGARALSKTEQGFYLGKDPKTPEIGDLKINFKIIKPANVSVVAQQQGNSFAPYQTKAGSPIDLLEMGMMDAKAMFDSAQSANTVLTWIIRLGGGFMMWLGFYMLLRPFAIVGSVLPILGDLIAMGAGLLAFFVALPFTLLTISIAWIVYRPVLAGGLIAAALLSFVAMKYVPRSNRALEKKPQGAVS